MLTKAPQKYFHYFALKARHWHMPLIFEFSTRLSITTKTFQLKNVRQNSNQNLIIDIDGGLQSLAGCFCCRGDKEPLGSPLANPRFSITLLVT